MDAQRWMRRALELAERGRLTVSPNPMVGCVLVRDGAVVGEGWHERAGGPHAEVVALAAAGEAARGAVAYVTLEPCGHHGRTPPCTQALLDAGVARVVVALGDPNPEARGGAGALRAGGVEVDVGVLAGEARRQNEVFLHGIAAGRPFVTVKTAVSLDGRIAAAEGTSRWLTGARARRRAHLLRAEFDAVLVGSQTVLADDPQLTVRLDEAAPATPAAPGAPGGHDTPATPGRRAPLRVVLDRRRRTRPSHRVVDASAPTLVVTAPAQVEDGWLATTGADVACVPALGGAAEGLDLHGVLALLWARDVRSLLVEGGARVASAFLRAGLADRLDVHVAPLLLGERGVPAVSGPWAATLAEAPRFRLDGVERAGDDLLLTLRPPRDPLPAPGGGSTAEVVS